MADIQQNSGDGAGSAMTAIVAILVIVIIALAVYFGFFRGAAAPIDNASDINVTVPVGSGGGSATE